MVLPHGVHDSVQVDRIRAEAEALDGGEGVGGFHQSPLEPADAAISHVSQKIAPSCRGQSHQRGGKRCGHTRGHVEESSQIGMLVA